MKFTFSSSNTYDRLFATFAVIFSLLAVIGVVNNYSPVPFWDMWNGYLDFYSHVIQGDYSIWWSQHNEHRIILSRVLFWLDIKLFSGEIWFLLLCNILLLCAVVYVIQRFIIESGNKDQRWLLFFVICWLLYWSQYNNMTWGFQSQFILAYLLPISAFYNLAKYNESKGSIYFFFANLFAFAAIGSMANGILAMPLLLLLSFVYRLPKSKLVLTSLFTIVSCALFFYDYDSIKGEGHTSISQALISYPLETIEYIFVYLGSPFYYMFRGRHYIALVAGLFFVATFAYCFFKTVVDCKENNKSSHNVAIIFGIIYIAGTAFVTAAGRVSQGLEQALSSRYTTPALIAWALLLVILLPYFRNFSDIKQNRIKSSFLVIIIAMLPYQLKALKHREEAVFNEKLAALQVALHIKDDKQILFTFPNPNWAIQIVSNDAVNQASIFSKYPYKDMFSKLGTTIEAIGEPTERCRGNVESVTIVNNDFIRISGWGGDEQNSQTNEYGYILNKEQQIVGAVILGMQRKDVKEIHGYGLLFSGFVGYVNNTSERNNLDRIIFPNLHCDIKILVGN